MHCQTETKCSKNTNMYQSKSDYGIHLTVFVTCSWNSVSNIFKLDKNSTFVRFVPFFGFRFLVKVNACDFMVYVYCSWHQTTKPGILFSQIFSTRFFQHEQLKKNKKTFYWSKTGFFLVLYQWKVCFLFHLVKLRKNLQKKLGKTKFVVFYFK